MKKIIAVICLLAITVMALVSCGVNFKNMEKKLDDKGYSVFTYSKADLAKEDDADDSVIVANMKESLNEQLKDSSVSEILIAVKVNLKDLLSSGDVQALMVVKFEKSEDAQKFEKEIKDDQDTKDYVVKRSGKVVYAGTEEAVKIVK